MHHRLLGLETAWKVANRQQTLESNCQDWNRISSWPSRHNLLQGRTRLGLQTPILSYPWMAHSVSAVLFRFRLIDIELKLYTGQNRFEINTLWAPHEFPRHQKSSENQLQQSSKGDIGIKDAPALWNLLYLSAVSCKPDSLWILNPSNGCKANSSWLRSSWGFLWIFHRPHNAVLHVKRYFKPLAGAVLCHMCLKKHRLW